MLSEELQKEIIKSLNSNYLNYKTFAETISSDDLDLLITKMESFCSDSIMIAMKG